MNDDKALIEKLLELYDAQKAMPDEHTFLEVIGRAHDEDMISRVLAHILQTDPELVAAMFRFYSRQKDAGWEICDLGSFKVTAEKPMGKGRADIFIEADGYTLTIENKINSWEHDDQTKTYFDFVTSNYRDTENGFIYLKPEYNLSEPNSDEFVQMTYGTLKNLIEEYGKNEKFEEDLKRHIEKYLIKWNGDIMESDLMVLKNYKKLREMLDNAENKFANAKREIPKALFGGELIGSEEIKDYRDERRKGVFVADVTNNRWHRLSKNKVWRYDGGTDKGRKYYFYLELDIEEPQRITTQMTVKYYGKPQESFLYRFIESEGRKMMDGNWYNHYFVSSPRGEFESGFELLSNEWMFDLLQYVKNTFAEYLNTMDALFAKFIEAYSSEFGGAEL